MALNPEMIGWIGIVVLLVLLLLRIPVAFVLAFVGFTGYWLIAGPQAAFKIAGIVPYSTMANYSFSVVPLFLLMGYFAFHAGFATDMFKTGKIWLGHIPGGLGHATILGGAAFGAVSGSGIASTATIARITTPEMVNNGVNKSLAYGIVASAGPLASMIPPSMIMVIYAIITESSIAKLFVAGILPGLLIALLYILMVWIRVKINPDLAPPVQKTPFKERIISLKYTWGLLVLGFIIIGGIYTGLFTPTEAGGIGAFAAFIMALLLKRINRKVMKESLIETIKTTSMVFLIVVGSMIFGYFLGITRIPTMLSDLLTTLPVAPIVIIIGVVILYLILGMFIDMISAMFLTLPIIFPTIINLGYDPIWFGIVIVFLTEVALVTPPLGLSLFVIKGAVPDSDIKEIIRGSIPFIAIDIVILVLLIAFPEITLFLPNKME
ncbi:TRAP transporter large permease subunit [Bacillus sp. B15-48]|uniref:TRAP transporter large permease n=1 Tax=Bacillus sp. B15-48 TaxID=1548601 RepID=UPI00193ECA64|nr:TRAP transporter large permease subunit [Bacillus sp. B15-48]MBM4764998.1 TRAP transporter large permease subunit [Bacillus sp. B15-48]